MTTTPFRLAGQFLGMLEKHVQRSGRTEQMITEVCARLIANPSEKCQIACATVEEAERLVGEIKKRLSTHNVFPANLVGHPSKRVTYDDLADTIPQSAKQLAEQAAATAKMLDDNIENMFFTTRATRVERVTRVKIQAPPLRKIYRIEKAANKSAWYEILSCGHRGEHVFGPNRMYIALAGMPNARRCQECAKEGRK